MQPKLIKIKHKTTESVVLIPMVAEYDESSITIFCIHEKIHEGLYYYSVQKEDIIFDNDSTGINFIKNFDEKSAMDFANSHTPDFGV